jgi:MFS family permease
VATGARDRNPQAGFLGFSGYHWLVIGAAWAGWGFDVFDALLFNFVAPNCIPQLLALQPGSPAAHAATVFWTGALASILLISWAAGGVLFGWVADRIGRKRALFATIALYAGGTRFESWRAWGSAANGESARHWLRKPFPRTNESPPA